MKSILLRGRGNTTGQSEALVRAEAAAACGKGAFGPRVRTARLFDRPRGVGIEVDEVDDTLNWSSVIVRGDFEELTGSERLAEKPAALDRAERGPMRWIYDPDVPERARDSIVIGAIRVRDMSGRRERWTWARPKPLPLSFAAGPQV